LPRDFGAAQHRQHFNIEDAIVALAIEQPAFGQVRIANELQKCGLTVSPAPAGAASGTATTWRQ
jgi:hypothetical protein